MRQYETELEMRIRKLEAQLPKVRAWLKQLEIEREQRERNERRGDGSRENEYGEAKA